MHSQQPLPTQKPSKSNTYFPDRAEGIQAASTHLQYWFRKLAWHLVVPFVWQEKGKRDYVPVVISVLAKYILGTEIRYTRI